MKNHIKLNKATRLLFIASLVKSSALGAVQALPSEIQEEAQLITRGQDTGNLPIDEDLPDLPSRLAFRDADAIGTGEHDAILTASERAQIARDLAEYRAKEAKKWAIVPVGFWDSINLIEV